jgi:hypothetical protein
MSVKTLKQNIVSDYYTRKKIFRALISMIVVLSLCYVYFIGSTIFSVLARKSLETNAKELASRVGQLEVKYIQLSGSIDSEYGETIGFIDAGNMIFASRAKDKVALR